jgi:hypothetical protein
MAATESVGSTAPDQSHTTFVPNSHPFAHARLLNVVVSGWGGRGGGDRKGMTCVRRARERRNGKRKGLQSYASSLRVEQFFSVHIGRHLREARGN